MTLRGGGILLTCYLYKKKNKIKGNVKQKVFAVESVKQEILIYNKTKNFKVKYCTLLQSNSLEYI